MNYLSPNPLSWLFCCTYSTRVQEGKIKLVLHIYIHLCTYRIDTLLGLVQKLLCSYLVNHESYHELFLA
ncbi:hypothetical protein VTK26DRAFT_4188 [Humicola hyalothermophila]